MDAQRERANELRRRDRRRELERIDCAEAGAEKTLEKCEAEAREKPIEFRARAELEAIERTLAERRELAVTAACIDPPAYITKELGERPADAEKRRSWEAGVRTIEGYRQEHGVKDPDHAFGRDTGRSAERAASGLSSGYGSRSGRWGGSKRRRGRVDSSLGIGR
jgi:hypothetical protein